MRATHTSDPTPEGRGIDSGIAAAVGTFAARVRERPQPRAPLARVALAAGAAFVTIAVLALLADTTTLPILAAAFGSSCVLVFSFPDSPLSHPANIVAGHLVSAACGVAVSSLLPVAWWSLAVAVALALATMALLRVSHPPAGGTPIVIMLTGAGWGYLLTPIIVGAVVVAVFAMIHRRMLTPSGARGRRGR